MSPISTGRNQEAATGPRRTSNATKTVGPYENGPRPFVLSLEETEWDLASRDRLAKVLEPTYRHRHVVVDLRAVEYIDSTCLGKLIRMRNERATRGFEPERLVLGSPRLRRLFGIVSFDAIWPLFYTLEEALRDF